MRIFHKLADALQKKNKKKKKILEKTFANLT